ncbi:MAG: prepilin-type N-terminal cleavage/methylation domain-containing protein [Methylomonas sp.]|jgi:general secretion pathway protein J
MYLTGNQRWKGFTLIEMLIALTLLSIMVILLFSSLKIAADSWNSGAEKVMEANKKAVVYQFLRQHLTSIRPLMTQLSQQSIQNGESPQPIFLGQPQSIRFAGVLPQSSGRKGLQIFEIAASPDDPSKVMVTLYPYQSSQYPTVDKEVLLDHVQVIAFAYYGRTNANNGAGWTTNWVNNERPPDLIKVTILLDDYSYWPDMLFPVKINASVANTKTAPDSAN